MNAMTGNATPNTNGNPDVPPRSSCRFVMQSINEQREIQRIQNEDIKKHHEEVTKHHAEVTKHHEEVKKLHSHAKMFLSGLSVASVVIGALLWNQYTKVDQLMEYSARSKADIGSIESSVKDLKDDSGKLSDNLDELDKSLSKLNIEQSKNYYALLEEIRKIK
ncbi:TPA: hypothetical protein ACX6PV_000685 [Photobacterium damselae]